MFITGINQHVGIHLFIKILSYKLNTIVGHEQNEFELTAFIIILIMLSKLHTEGILRFFVRLLFKRSKNHNIK